MSFNWDPFVGDKWAPEKVGDWIKGRVKIIRIEQGRKGDVPVLTLATKDGDREVWPSSYLRRLLADLKPQRGDGLRIELTELRNTGQPQPMKVYAVDHTTEDEIERRLAAKLDGGGSSTSHPVSDTSDQLRATEVSAPVECHECGRPEDAHAPSCSRRPINDAT